MPGKGTGRGICLNHDGYLRITRRGPLREQLAHRAYANRQMRESQGRDLHPNEEVHHLCKNRTCWPPSDWHLVIMDDRIHHAIEGSNSGNKRSGKDKKVTSEWVEYLRAAP